MRSWYCPDLGCLLSPGGLESHHKQNPPVHHSQQWPGPGCGEELEGEEHPFPPGQPTCATGQAVALMSCFTLSFGHLFGFFSKAGTLHCGRYEGKQVLAPAVLFQDFPPPCQCSCCRDLYLLPLPCCSPPLNPHPWPALHQCSWWDLRMPRCLTGSAWGGWREIRVIWWIKKPKILSMHELQGPQ